MFYSTPLESRFFGDSSGEAQISQPAVQDEVLAVDPLADARPQSGSIAHDPFSSGDIETNTIDDVIPVNTTIDADIMHVAVAKPKSIARCAVDQQHWVNNISNNDDN